MLDNRRHPGRGTACPEYASCLRQPTFSKRRAWLGGLVTEWSPQQRAHWVAERVLEWSGVPTVNVRAAIFVENPILTWLALEPLGNGELRLPFGAQRFAPIAGYDVAELCVKILIDPAPHISKSYEVTGPELKDMHEFAADYAAVLGRQVTYVPEDVETWNEQYVDSALAAYPHIAEHLKDLTRWSPADATAPLVSANSGNPARAPAEDRAVGAGEPSTRAESGCCEPLSGPEQYHDAILESSGRGLQYGCRFGRRRLLLPGGRRHDSTLI